MRCVAAGDRRRPSAGGAASAVCRDTGAPGWTGGSVPSRPNSHTLSPRAEPSSALPAEYASTYCLPLCSNVLDRRVHAGAGLELPELLAGGRVERGEPAVVAADEQQPAGGRERAAVALLGPLVAPRELVGGDVERGEDAGARDARERRRAAEERAAVPPAARTFGSPPPV